MNRYLVKIALGIAAIVLGWTFNSPVQGALVTKWDLNPQNLNQPAGTASRTFTVWGYSITAYGWDNIAGPDRAHNLYYKNVGDIHGLGITCAPDHELQVNRDGSPAQYIQLDLSSILTAGFTNGEIKVSGIDPGEAFSLYGSNKLGKLGTQIGSVYGSDNNNAFVNIPDFGDYDFISVVSAAGDVLPWAFMANCPVIPEAGGTAAALALLAFSGVVMASRAIRERGVC